MAHQFGWRPSPSPDPALQGYAPPPTAPPPAQASQSSPYIPPFSQTPLRQSTREVLRVLNVFSSKPSYDAPPGPASQEYSVSNAPAASSRYSPQPPRRASTPAYIPGPATSEAPSYGPVPTFIPPPPPLPPPPQQPYNYYQPQNASPPPPPPPPSRSPAQPGAQQYRPAQPNSYNPVGNAEQPTGQHQHQYQGPPPGYSSSTAGPSSTTFPPPPPRPPQSVPPQLSNSPLLNGTLSESPSTSHSVPELTHLLDHSGKPPKPTAALESLLRGIAEFIQIKYLDSSSSLPGIITPMQLATFYRRNLRGERLYQSIFIYPARLTALYRSLECEHVLISNPQQDSRDVMRPALTVPGFQRWISLQILLYPDLSATLLSKVLSSGQVPCGPTTYFPERPISRGVLPQVQDPWTGEKYGKIVSTALSEESDILSEVEMLRREIEELQAARDKSVKDKESSARNFSALLQAKEDEERELQQETRDLRRMLDETVSENEAQAQEISRLKREARNRESDVSELLQSLESLKAETEAQQCVLEEKAREISRLKKASAEEQQMLKDEIEGQRKTIAELGRSGGSPRSLPGDGSEYGQERESILERQLREQEERRRRAAAEYYRMKAQGANH